MILLVSWQLQRFYCYTEHDKSGEFNSIVYSKGEFILGITVWKNQNKCQFSLIKEDWIYKKGF